MKTCIITGSSGLLGSNLIPYLVKEFNVYAIIRNKSAVINNNHINPVYLDLNKRWSVDLLPNTVDVIIHLAQSENHNDLSKDVKSLYKINCETIIDLLEYGVKCGVKKVIVASSGGVYDNSMYSHKEEDRYTNNPNLYIASKICSEIMSKAYFKKTDISIIRPFFIYGKNQKSNMLFPRLINSLKKNLPITINGKKGVMINPIYVGDTAKSVYQLISKKDIPYVNIAGSEKIYLYDAIKIISNLLNVKPIINHTDSKDSTNILGDISLMKKHLGEPKIQFEKGIIDLTF